MDELFIYLGKIDNVFFFIHTVKNKEKYKKETAYQIYNCMINETMITDYNNIVVVFENNTTFDAIIMQHEKNKTMFNFDKKNLNNIVGKLFASERKGNNLVFSFNYDVGAFYTYQISLEFHANSVKGTIDKMSYIQVNKPIAYLKIEK